MIGSPVRLPIRSPGGFLAEFVRLKTFLLTMLGNSHIKCFHDVHFDLIAGMFFNLNRMSLLSKFAQPQDGKIHFVHLCLTGAVDED